jgi:uncharacterized SAM-binding protein YcdF (DUF218 family)
MKRSIKGLVAGAILFICLLSTATCWLVGEDVPRRADVIVVLGCRVNADGSPSPMMQRRVMKAVELFNQKYAAKLLFTGGAVTSDYKESEVMSQYAQGLGVPSSAIELESYARSTIENAKNTDAIMKLRGWHSAIVVTSTFHLPRVRSIFKDLGGDFLFVGAPLPGEFSMIDHALLYLEELGKWSYKSRNTVHFYPP